MSNNVECSCCNEIKECLTCEYNHNLCFTCKNDSTVPFDQCFFCNPNAAPEPVPAPVAAPVLLHNDYEVYQYGSETESDEVYNLDHSSDDEIIPEPTCKENIYFIIIYLLISVGISFGGVYLYLGLKYISSDKNVDFDINTVSISDYFSGFFLIIGPCIVYTTYKYLREKCRN